MLVAIERNMKLSHWHLLQEGTIATEKSMKSQGWNFIVCYPFPVKSKSPRSNFIIFFLNLKNQRWWIQMIKSSAFDSWFLNNEILWFSFQNPTRSCWRICSNVCNGFHVGLNQVWILASVKNYSNLDLPFLCKIYVCMLLRLNAAS